MNLQSIIAEKREAILDAGAKRGARRIRVFGSVARGSNDSGSDVDFLVEFDRPIDLFAFCDVEDFLAEMLGRKVDLVLHDSVKPLLSERILSEAVRVF